MSWDTVLMMVSDMLIPVIMVGIGLLFVKRPPRIINGAFGYRTRMSMKNEKTWRFAHQYFGRLWLLIGIPEETIRKICEAGTYAASGKGNQSPIIIAVTDKALRDKLSRMNAKIMGTDIDPFYGAPVVLVVLADRKFPTYIYDGSLVIGNLMLAAHSEGIGSCWIHRAKEEFQSEEGKEILKSLGIGG